MEYDANNWAARNKACTPTHFLLVMKDWIWSDCLAYNCTDLLLSWHGVRSDSWQKKQCRTTYKLWNSRWYYQSALDKNYTGTYNLFVMNWYSNGNSSKRTLVSLTDWMAGYLRAANDYVTDVSLTCCWTWEEKWLDCLVRKQCHLPTIDHKTSFNQSS